MRNKVRKQVSGSLITDQETLSNEKDDGVRQSAQKETAKYRPCLTYKAWVKYPPAMGLLCKNKV